MLRLDLTSLFAGTLAYLASILVSSILVFLFLQLNAMLTRNPKEGKRRRRPAKGKRSFVANLLRSAPDDSRLNPRMAQTIALGSATLGQAILLRHAVFPVMAVIRDLMLSGFSMGAAAKVALQCGFFLIALGSLAFISVWIAGGLFVFMTGDLDERDEILRGNVACAVLFSLVLLGITLILNEGIGDLARALIPYGREGVIRLP